MLGEYYELENKWKVEIFCRVMWVLKGEFFKLRWMKWSFLVERRALRRGSSAKLKCRFWLLLTEILSFVRSLYSETLHKNSGFDSPPPSSDKVLAFPICGLRMSYSISTTSGPLCANLWGTVLNSEYVFPNEVTELLWNVSDYIWVSLILFLF